MSSPTTASAAAHDAPAVPMDRLPLPSLVIDGGGTIEYANDAAAGLLCEDGETLVGRDLFREVAAELESTGLGGRFRAGEQSFVVEAGRTRGSSDQWLRFHALRLWEDERAIVMIEDCSELSRERERRTRAERLASVGELAAGVAHEVNNPLASIKSFAQLLARDATNPEHREALDLIITESTRVAQIVENLLSFARQQGAGGRAPVSLSAIAERVLQIQRYALDTAGIRIRRDFDSSLSPVMGEVGALQQVVLNLVVNAEHALASREGERLLIIRTRESTEGVILAVVDNGPGIPREMLPQIFERFRTTKPGGTGLGLAISAAIVRDHSGQIWAESDEGRGTAFYVQLPRSTVGLVPEVEPEPDEPACTDGARRALRVLVADDEPALRLAISMFLGRLGHTVVQAPDAYEALRLAQEQPFDVALVDARMPGDGLKLLEQLESIPGLRGRTALMTGDLGRARTSQGIATGRPYLTKPFDMDEMVVLLETLGG